MVTREPIATSCICCASQDLDRSPAVLMPFVAYRVFGHQPVEITPEWGLRDLQQGMAYTLCNSLQCQECGVLFLDYRFTDAQMAGLYQGYRNSAYTLKRDYFEPGYAFVADHYKGREDYITEVESWLSNFFEAIPSILDWGGGNGQNTPFLGRSSPLHVYDISTVKVVKGAHKVEESDLTSYQYDLVTCSQVLEHVPYPLMVLERIRNLISADTFLYIEVPLEELMRTNCGNRDLAKVKRHWHEHVNFFTLDSLQILINKAGFDFVANCNLSVDLGWRKGQVMGILAKPR